MTAAPLPGSVMQREMYESPEVFARAATQSVNTPGLLTDRSSIYTIARGSSDAVATMLAYEIMDTLQIPVTCLPPSVFSLRQGLNLKHTSALIISQSGASEDLQRCANGVSQSGGNVIAITNNRQSPVARGANDTIDVCAGPEIAVPATKSVVGSIGAGMALLAANNQQYATGINDSVAAFEALQSKRHPTTDTLLSDLQHARSLYIVGRGTGYGASQEVALKFKETSAIHAEAYSASEVMHGPLQLVSERFVVVMLDTNVAAFDDSLTKAQARFTAAGASVHRMRVTDLTSATIAPAASAALLLFMMYPVIHQLTLDKGLNPDTPQALCKVTNTL